MGWMKRKPTSARNTLDLGDYNVIDDLMGFKRKASQCRLRWDNILVTREDWEPRHPQDFLRAKPDRQKVENARPEQPDKFFISRTPDELT